MPSTSLQRLAAACVWGTLALGGPVPSSALAEHTPPPAAIAASSTERLHRIGPRSSERKSAGSSASSGGWWLGTAGVALALAVVGGVSLASKRLRPLEHGVALRVVGQVGLGPRHAVHLLRAGDRTLIIGTGPQGAPALLGEWSELIQPEPPTRPIGGGA